MPVTQADIDALTNAIKNGTRQVTTGAESITYRSMSELITARDRLQAEFNQTNNVQRPRQVRLYQGGRGYE